MPSKQIFIIYITLNTLKAMENVIEIYNRITTSNKFYLVPTAITMYLILPVRPKYIVFYLVIQLFDHWWRNGKKMNNLDGFLDVVITLCLIGYVVIYHCPDWLDLIADKLKVF